MAYTHEELARIVKSPELSMSAASELLRQFQGADDEGLTLERNSELTIMAACIDYQAQIGQITHLSYDLLAASAKGMLMAAYLMGRRDAEPLPSAFSEWEA